jgi:peptidoglycan hydrolase-like amidase
MPCERLRSRLQLPSCPTGIEARDSRFVFSGVGAGHGLGLDVEKARAQSAAGKSADAILDDAWPRP